MEIYSEHGDPAGSKPLNTDKPEDVFRERKMKKKKKQGEGRRRRPRRLQATRKGRNSIEPYMDKCWEPEIPQDTIVNLWVFT